MPHPAVLRRLSEAQIAEVVALAARVEAATGHRPLNDHLWTDLRRGGLHGFAACEIRGDAATGDAIRARSLDSTSVGVKRQAELRGSADGDGFVEPLLWTGIGRARSGCGAALVGTPDQIVDKIMNYRDMGIEAFIFSGYPHADEARRFAASVLPRLPHGPTDFSV